MGKIVGVKILVQMQWIIVWMTEQQVKELLETFNKILNVDKQSVHGAMQGTCLMTGITWVVSLSEIVAVHTITDADTQQMQQQMAQAQGPRPLAPSPFRGSGRV
jgi:hypothetical protein